MKKIYLALAAISIISLFSRANEGNEQLLLHMMEQISKERAAQKKMLHDKDNRQENVRSTYLDIFKRLISRNKK